ncbi:Hypothetical_protein [Hexamita inflata]|uniref:Hypothetical_protein n=1 Tax=Hexamita inflata TaxID=28002 RepID=A0AA86RKF8_9EUKA|nr:Hypothetical protein HINF_LOCUS55795 [Hexamita inflata]
MFIKVQRIKQICLQVYNYLSVGYLSETSWESVIPNLEQTGQIGQILLHTRYGVFQHIQSLHRFFCVIQIHIPGSFISVFTLNLFNLPLSEQTCEHACLKPDSRFAVYTFHPK